MDLIFPADMAPNAALVLIGLSAFTSFLTAAAGIGGGILLLAVMAVLVPAAAVIPVHGAVQIGSNAGRMAIMFPHVKWQILAPFGIGSLLGAGLGGSVAVQLPPAWLQAGLGCFILWSVWGPKPGATGRLAVLATGLFSSFLTMFFGATGTFISAMVKTLKLDRMQHVATHSACMVVQHLIKIVVFGLFGFAFGPYLGLVGAMVASGFVGTVIGKRILLKMNDVLFHQVLSVLLTLLAVRLLYQGASALMV